MEESSCLQKKTNASVTMDPFIAQIQTNYLKDNLEKICNTDKVDEALISSLKEVLRNQVPTAWKELEDLYRTAVECVEQINLFHPESMGRRDDKSSLLSALLDFSKQAEFIAKSMTDAELEKFCLEVAKIATDTANYYESGKVALCRRDEEMDDLSGDDDYKNGTHCSGAIVDSIKNPKAHVKQYQDVMRSLCVDINSRFNWKIHSYLTDAMKANGNHSLDISRLYRELAAYNTQLPVDYASSIFVRASDKHLDLVRACIVGPEGTPYEHGLYFFDIYLKNYPHEAPKVTSLTGQGKHRLNPNLYVDGKVCLSLLGTWMGPGW